MPPTSPQWHTATFTAHTAREPPSATTLPVSAFPHRGFRKAGEPAQFSPQTESCRCSRPSVLPPLSSALVAEHRRAGWSQGPAASLVGRVSRRHFCQEQLYEVGWRRDVPIAAWHWPRLP